MCVKFFSEFVRSHFLVSENSVSDPIPPHSVTLLKQTVKNKCNNNNN